MRRVAQNGEEGCGIACVAMIVGTTYQEARSKLPGSWESNGTTKEEMRRGLRKFGITTHAAKPIGNKRYENIDFDALLLGYLDDQLHWTVWDHRRKKLLDPYRDKQGGKLRFRCTSFVRVERRKIGRASPSRIGSVARWVKVI